MSRRRPIPKLKCRLFFKVCVECGTDSIRRTFLPKLHLSTSSARLVVRKGCFMKLSFPKVVFWDRLFFSATTTALLALFLSVVGLSVLTWRPSIAPWRRKGLLLGLSPWLSLELKCLGLAWLLGLLYFPLLWFGTDFGCWGGALVFQQAPHLLLLGLVSLYGLGCPCFASLDYSLAKEGLATWRCLLG